MEKVMYNGKLYHIINRFNFSGSKHIIIRNNEKSAYLNYHDDNYYLPPNDLSIDKNPSKPLSFIRKQYFLNYFISFVNERNITEDSIFNKLLRSFKEFINSSNVERFLYWPLLSEEEFRDELKQILLDLQYQLEQVLVIDKEKNSYIDDRMKKVN